MRIAKAILAVLLAVSLAGCILRGKTAAKAPAAPKPAVTPAPGAPTAAPALSIPQTRAELPAPQPVPADALAVSPPPEAELPPAPAPPARQPARPKPPQASAPKPEAPAVPAPEPGRAPVQEVLPAEERNRLREEANGARREVAALLARLPARLVLQQRDQVNRIETFLRQSLDADRRGDLRQANELAVRGLVLARELR